MCDWETLELWHFSPFSARTNDRIKFYCFNVQYSDSCVSGCDKLNFIVLMYSTLIRAFVVVTNITVCIFMHSLKWNTVSLYFFVRRISASTHNQSCGKNYWRGLNWSTSSILSILKRLQDMTYSSRSFGVCKANFAWQFAGAYINHLCSRQRQNGRAALGAWNSSCLKFF